ncbi:hypothetical protein POM88_051758 [Heracleum sosnowskyi]|uniref:Ubiquitin-like protein ATG12 n=1 Tax=Heracleum sosnowskyi TaxID=360622 RepID=A0AAD8M3U2_9APIA|nr:hypothetical protein POM88_051758 [Heracleum sosnowskyi]
MAAPKVVVHLRATGDAPILKQSKFKIGGTEKFAKVIEFLRRQLHRETLFVYVNGAFSPNPDELVIDLYNNFAAYLFNCDTAFAHAAVREVGGSKFRVGFGILNIGTSTRSKHLSADLTLLIHGPAFLDVGLDYKMDSPLLTSLSLAVVVIYFTLLVQPQPVPILVSALPPPPPAASPPPPPRQQRADTPPAPRNKNSHPRSPPPPPKRKTGVTHRTNHKHKTPPHSKQKLNLGKKIGLLFAGVVAILQRRCLHFGSYLLLSFKINNPIIPDISNLKQLHVSPISPWISTTMTNNGIS